MIQTNDLQFLLQDPRVQLVDCRPPDAYNGWPMPGEPRGGHIPGARCLPFRWMRYVDWPDIVASKGLNAKHPLIVYGSDSDQIRQVAARFEKMGFNGPGIYTTWKEEWLPDEQLPVNRLERFRQLVPAEWVYEQVQRKNVNPNGAHSLLVLHVHYRNREAYLSGHIPGAVDLDTLAIESPEDWNRRSPGELKTALEAHGITADTTVVVYGKFMAPDNRDAFPGSAAGHLGAIRAAFILLYAGVKDVRVLNGGFQSWKDAGFPVDTDDVPKKPVSDFGVRIPQHPELAVDLPQAKEMLQSADADLVCVRSWPEYIGEVSGYNYIEPKGRIPGAIFGNCGSDAYHMENYRNPDHTVREFPEVEQMWKESGITPDKHLAFYCGTGWRGSEAFFHAWLMGWPRVSVFDGGWFEWSKDPSNPFETGLPG